MECQRPLLRTSSRRRNKPCAIKSTIEARSTARSVFGPELAFGAYQKAESLPITGQIDTHTAAALGVRPESTWNNVQGGREVSHKDKPSAGIARVESRASGTRRKDIAQQHSPSGIANNPNQDTNK
jgi:hypothetical protein